MDIPGLNGARFKRWVAGSGAKTRMLIVFPPVIETDIVRLGFMVRAIAQR